ncbi:MAG TPA: nuclear transport factor 2 family protein [Geothrix sp.]|nr:nuclear transport factor 2 family protein [Geothrix sp.]
MKPFRLLALPIAALLISCHSNPMSMPVASDENSRTVLAFLRAYGKKDLDGMMSCLDEEATFVGSGAALSKPQIRDFFLAAFRKHPNLRVEVAALKSVQGSVHAEVRVETEAIWTDTWIFEMKHHRIHRYALASGTRSGSR